MALPGELQSEKVDRLIWGAILGEINVLLSGSHNHTEKMEYSGRMQSVLNR